MSHTLCAYNTSHESHSMCTQTTQTAWRLCAYNPYVTLHVRTQLVLCLCRHTCVVQAFCLCCRHMSHTISAYNTYESHSMCVQHESHSKCVQHTCLTLYTTVYHTCLVHKSCTKMIGLFCKRARQKRQYSAKETYHLKEPTNRCKQALHAQLYGVATMCSLLKMMGLFCKRALQKRQCSANETYHLKLPTYRW